MTDTHCHLDYLEEAELVPALQATKHFQAVLSVGTSPQKSQRNLDLAQAHFWVWAAVGVHPTEAPHWPEWQPAIRDLSQHPKVRAIGETGLDYYWTPQTRTQQLAALDGQAALAAERKLPLIFHVRSATGSDHAERDLADWLSRNQPERYVLHAFGGHPALVEVGLQQGAYFSFAGPFTYKKNQEVRQVAAQLPLERLLVETDSPFLPPEPHRGKRNQPAWVVFTLAKLAEVRGLSLAQTEQATDANAQRLFGFAP